MKLFDRRLFAVAAAAALVLSVGFVNSASASPPRNQFDYPMVHGVNGALGSSVEMGYDQQQAFQVDVVDRVPWVTADGETANVFFRFDQLDHDMAKVSGEYCKNKTGGDVFVNTGAPSDPSLTCP